MLAGLTIAQRDAALFHVRRPTFGSQLKGLSDCPACRERLELAFNADDLRGEYPAGGEVSLPDPELTNLHNAVTSFELKGYQVSFRLPTSADLLNIAGLTQIDTARRQLLQACLVSVRRRKKVVSVHELPADVTDAIIERIGQNELLANLTIAATCPACGHKWEVVFDIVSYFWSEINAWAVRNRRRRPCPGIHLWLARSGHPGDERLAQQRYLEMIGV